MASIRKPNPVLWFSISLIVIILAFLSGKHSSKNNSIDKSIIINVGERTILENDNKWTRSFLSREGTVYTKGNLKSVDGGKSFLTHQEVDMEDILAKPERAMLQNGDLFYALNGPTEITKPGVFKVKSWRSENGLKTLTEEESFLYIPDGPVIHFENDRWNGLFVYRTILEMSDGSWLATMYGNFAVDTLDPQGNDAARECKFMMRTFVVTSSDKGKTWNYLSSVAVPHSGDPVGEGFVEPAITRLQDGRLLCIMRSGHHFPLYASWSSDDGKTWTAPLYTGLDRGCDPCLITLNDGRLALSWGRRFPEGWSRVDSTGDKGHFVYPGEGYNNLAISNDEGETWNNTIFARNTGSCYSTIYEIEPGLVFCQVDKWCWQLKIAPVD